MKISQHPFLQEVDQTQLEELSKVTVVEEIPPDTTIFEEGSPSDGLYLVLKGEVAFCKTAPDHSRREVLQKATSFSIRKYGEKRAFQLAVAHRRKMLREIHGPGIFLKMAARQNKA